MILEIVFWAAVILIAYTYLVYPVLLVVRGFFFRQPFTTADITPKVSILIAARNEEQSIGHRLDNLLEIDYPKDQMEVIVASDGSTDNTVEIVRFYSRYGMKVLDLPHLGKADALNAAAAEAVGEILIFSDANSMYAPKAVRELVSPFADDGVGGVAGNQVYLKKGKARVNTSEHSYWNFDRILKKLQSLSGSTISATGAIYAIRRTLFQPIPPGVTDDFVTSTNVVRQNYRLVFAPDAIAYEPASASSGAEFARKVRIITRGLQGVIVQRSLLNPFQYGFYAVELFSHKVLRRLVVFPLLILVLVSPFLWDKGLFFQLLTLGQAAFYSLALLGYFLRRSPIGHNKLFALPYFFCMVYFASFLAAINVVRGHRIDRWEPQRVIPSDTREQGIGFEPEPRG